MVKGPATIAVTVWLLLAVLGCEGSDNENNAMITDLVVQVLDGYIAADMMPPVPPDPITCELTLRVTNANSSQPLSGLSIPSAVVFLAQGSRELGTIGFETDWDGSLEAGEVDTVTVKKIEESKEVFAPPCQERVYLRLMIVKTVVQTKQVTTPSYDFSCPVTQREKWR
jgi:hypothetical protein